MKNRGSVWPILLIGLAFSCQPALLGQGTLQPVVLRTGSNQPLTTLVVTNLAFTATNPATLQIQFGFATEELFGPNTNFDSFTATLQDMDGQSTLVIVTADAGGVVWAPSTPGGLVIDPASIGRSAIPFPSLQPTLPQQTAFDISLSVPPEFYGKSTVLYFDLFDNLDNANSLGFYSAVPEPAGSQLALLGAMALIFFKRMK